MTEPWLIFPKSENATKTNKFFAQFFKISCTTFSVFRLLKNRKNCPKKCRKILAPQTYKSFRNNLEIFLNRLVTF